MSSDLMMELLKLLPSILWFFFVVAILLIYRQPVSRLFDRLGAFEAMGVKLVIIQNSMDAAVELAEKSQKWKVQIPPEDKRRALDRVKQHIGLFKGVQLLWVDDNPENNFNERRMFRQLAVDIDTVKSTEEALKALRQGAYDVIVSDMVRGDDRTAGMDLLRRLSTDKNFVPVIFYVGSFTPQQGTPAMAFGITNRPDELLHLMLDVLERRHN